MAAAGSVSCRGAALLPISVASGVQGQVAAKVCTTNFSPAAACGRHGSHGREPCRQLQLRGLARQGGSAGAQHHSRLALLVHQGGPHPHPRPAGHARRPEGGQQGAVCRHLPPPAARHLPPPARSPAVAIHSPSTLPPQGGLATPAATPAGPGQREEKLQKLVADLQARLAAAEAQQSTVRLGRLGAHAPVAPADVLRYARLQITGACLFTDSSSASNAALRPRVLLTHQPLLPHAPYPPTG